MTILTERLRAIASELFRLAPWLATPYPWKENLLYYLGIKKILRHTVGGGLSYGSNRSHCAVMVVGLCVRVCISAGKRWLCSIWRLFAESNCGHKRRSGLVDLLVSDRANTIRARKIVLAVTIEDDSLECSLRLFHSKSKLVFDLAECSYQMKNASKSWSAVFD